MVDKLAPEIEVLTSSTFAGGDLLVMHDTSAGKLKSITLKEFELITGVFNVLSYGATGDGSTDDAAAIQAAIDAASTAGGGTVVIPYPSSHYVIGSTLTTAANVRIHAAQNAELRMGIDDELIRVLPNSSIFGGYWRNNYASLSQGTPIIQLLSDSSTVFDRDEFCSLQNMLIQGPSAGNLGIGINMETGGNSSTIEAVQWVQCSNIVIDNAYKAINLLSNEDTGDAQSFTNGNNFTNIGIDHCVYGIYLDATGTAASATAGNGFTNVSIQVRSLLTNAITIADENCKRNMFDNIQIWDVANGALGASTIAIAGTNTSTAKEGNCFTNCRGPISTQVSLGNNDVEQPAFPAS